MDYLAILSLILGLVSVVITLQFIKYYDSFDKKLNKINKSCLSKNLPSSIFDIQDILNMSDKEFNNILAKNKSNIASFIKQKIPPTKKEILEDVLNEEFSNYNYLNTKQRNIDNYPLTNIISKKNNCILKKRTYNTDIKQSRIGAEKLTPKIPMEPVHNQIKNYKIDKSINGLRYNFVKKNWCLVNHDNKNYCFSLSNKDKCPSKIILKNRSFCNF